MVDLDRFKNFNDEFGHQSGDVYLKRAAEIWRDSLRPEDCIARYGGEEFVVLLRDTELAGAIESLDRMRAANPPPLTCSVGVAQWDGTETPDRLIGRADHALYQAKDSGRNCVVAAPAPELVSNESQDRYATPARATLLSHKSSKSAA
jgi:diguanylate cyclase (GGDEF)-like protein